MSTVIEPLECPLEDVASVPRRFGVGVLMILMTAFAVLFAGMRTFGARPEIFCVVAGLFLAVTLGQIFLFEGKKPRQSSLWAGGVVFPLEMVGVAIWTASQKDPALHPRSMDDLLSGVFCSFFAGAPVGYLAGCVMAGVFFVQERFRQRNPDTVKVELVPLTASDLDTLYVWLRQRPLFDFWSQKQFTYPPDSEKLRARFATTTSDAPDRIAYKAVSGPMQEMVGIVELAKIDRKRRRASIELAIVDPLQDDRAEISGRLVRAIMHEAYIQEGLRWLRVVLHRNAVESIKCFQNHGFTAVYRFVHVPEEGREYTMLIRSNRYYSLIPTIPERQPKS